MNDYLLETKLKNEAPDLHKRAADSVVVLQGMLESFRTWFPTFTDHSTLHSMDVLDFCNQLLSGITRELSAAECYVLIMASYLHDVGMGISRENYEEFTGQVDLGDYREKHPDSDEAGLIRAFHNEYSGLFIRKYAALFDIPTQELVFAIIQVSRGHRKTDLYDPAEYPDLETEYGIVRTAYLAALIRLADEIDIGADRNPELLFEDLHVTRQADIDAFGTHESIRTVEVHRDRIVLRVRLKEPRYAALIDDLAQKVQGTLDYCRDVAQKRSDLRITQERIEIAPAD